MRRVGFRILVTTRRESTINERKGGRQLNATSNIAYHFVVVTKRSATPSLDTIPGEHSFARENPLSEKELKETMKNCSIRSERK